MHFQILLVDGGLTLWSSFTECSKSCGEGEKQRSRLCANPAPAYGGRNCEGHLNEKLPCKVKECPGKFSYVKLFAIGYCF